MSHLFHVTTLNKSAFAKCQKALKPLYVPIEQSIEWGAFDDCVDDREFLGSFRYDDAQGRLVAIASASLYHEKGRDWIWIKHGPLFASVPNTKVIQKMCATLTDQFRVTNGTSPLFIRLTIPSQVKPLRQPFEHTMYDQTVVVDLTQTEEEILAHMSQSGRQGLRKSTKAGIIVKELPLRDAQAVFCQDFYPILAETADRGGFGIHPCSLYEKMLTALSPAAKLYGAYEGKQITSWAITTEYDQQALYYYGASNTRARDTFAPYILHWEIMKAMKKRGNIIYDFMGIAGKHYPSLKNVTQFKLKFSKNIQDVPVTYDLPLQPAKYTLLSQLIKLKRKLK